MKKTTILSVMAVLWLNFCTAQLLPSTFKIGKKLPDSILNHSFDVINDGEGKTSTTLNTYKGKLLILDFWASWCSSCLVKFPHLDSLQAQYSDRLSILLVSSKNTKDNIERMQKVLRGELTESKATQLASLTNDSLLMKLFPHQYLPHYVWIGAKGEVLAITPAEFVTHANIIPFLPNKP